MEWRLLDALFLALRNFANSNLAKEEATVDALVGMFYTIPCRIRALCGERRGVGIHTYRRGLRRCSFWQDGQCEGL